LRSGGLVGTFEPPDPEDLRAVIGAYHDYIGIIARNEGVIARYIDVLAYFAIPRHTRIWAATRVGGTVDAG
jgi:hypothetical protein